MIGNIVLIKGTGENIYILEGKAWLRRCNVVLQAKEKNVLTNWKRAEKLTITSMHLQDDQSRLLIGFAEEPKTWFW